MKQSKVAIIHYLPLEFYPPVTNLLELLDENSGIKYIVCSTYDNKGRDSFQNNKYNKIYRSPSVGLRDISIKKLIKILYFSISTCFRLLFFKPDKILYYESYSALPAFLFYLFPYRKAELFIHFHEFFSRNWYLKNPSKYIKYVHRLERNKLFKKAIWISQTNDSRVSLFLKDNPVLKRQKMYVLPNYPRKNWNKVKKYQKEKRDYLRIVYVGSLSIESTYIKEFCDWVIAQKGKVIYDIYSYNLHNDTLKYLNELGCNYINFYDKGIDYKKLPELFCKYDVGVILYKANSENFKYNAPNKLFEYLVCGLQVWYPDKMIGINPYKSKRVISIDFDKLEFNEIPLNNLKNDIYQNAENFTAESALKPLIERFVK